MTKAEATEIMRVADFYSKEFDIAYGDGSSSKEKYVSLAELSTILEDIQSADS